MNIMFGYDQVKGIINPFTCSELVITVTEDPAHYVFPFVVLPVGHFIHSDDPYLSE